MTESSGGTYCHIVLAGAGVLSLSYAGALTELYRHGIRFRSVSCCSAGTFIGALLCARGTPEGLEEDVRRVSLDHLEGRPASYVPDFFYALVPGFLALHPVLRWPFAKFRQPGFSEVFQELVGGDPAFKNLKIRFATAGFDIVQRRFLVYASDSDSHPNMKVSEALAIAVSIPFAYPPHERGCRIVLDAGVASECPVWMAADQDPSLPIIALRPLRRPRLGKHPRTIDAFLSETMGSATSGLDDYIISQMPRVKLMEIDCGDTRSSQFDLTFDEKEALISAGRRAAAEALQRFGPNLTKVSEPRISALLGDPNDAKALEHGIHLMTRFHQDMSKEVSNRVFISYCHADKEWFERIKKLFAGAFPISSTWDDTRIEPGEQWEKEIETAIHASRVAVLLLSPYFFQSEYISHREVPAILEASEKNSLIPIPIFVSADDKSWPACPLSMFQAVNDKQPLDTVSKEECDAVLKRVADTIKRAIQVS